MTSPARRCVLGLAAALVLGGLCTTQGHGNVVTPLAASSVALPALVSPDPSDTTPQVNDGAVRAIATVGNTVILGGTFTSAQDSTSATPVPRSRLLAFDKATGNLIPGFAPVLNGAVEAVVAGPNNSVYIGGGFTKIDGTRVPHLARLDVTTGALRTSFTPAAPNGRVNDIALVGSRLFIGGEFTRVGTHAINALAELRAPGGKFDTSTRLTFGRGLYGGPILVQAFDVTPDGSRMALIGNFSTINGHKRASIAQLKLTTDPVTVTGWATNKFRKQCAGQYFFYGRDLDYAPNGKYFVVVSTGGFADPATACDSASRWETRPGKPGRTPTWIDRTGGDSLYSVAVTGAAVYTGGHERWYNNPFAIDHPGPGAVARSGVGALDPANGLPLSWNPGRTRGHGVQALLATPDGLYMGSDTARVHGETHARIAFFPLDPAAVVPHPGRVHASADVYLLGARPAHPSGLDLKIRKRPLESPAGNTTTMDSAATWRFTRAATLVDGTLYAVTTNGKLWSRSFDGGVVGAKTEVDLHGLPDSLTGFTKIRSLFYDKGYFYFTEAGRTGLYRRGFTTEDDVLGAVERTVSPRKGVVNWQRMGGAFVVGHRLYYSDRIDGTLRSVIWRAAQAVPGSKRLVSGHGVDGLSWKARALIVAPRS